MTRIEFDTTIPATVSIDTETGATKVEISLINMEIPEGVLDEDGVFLLGSLVTEHQTALVERKGQEDREDAVQCVPYYPVGDVGWTCLTHDTLLHLRMESRRGATDLTSADFYCPVAGS